MNEINIVWRLGGQVRETAHVLAARLVWTYGPLENWFDLFGHDARVFCLLSNLINKLMTHKTNMKVSDLLK